MKKAAHIDYGKALLMMCDLCARAEQCESDLRLKMMRKGLDAAGIDRVIDYLYENNYLNEERFAKAYARDKHRFNGWGRLKLRIMLAAKGVGREAVTEALASLDEEEYAGILSRLAASKARTLDLSEHADRQKLLRSLYGRGCEPALIIPVIKRLQKND